MRVGSVMPRGPSLGPAPDGGPDHGCGLGPARCRGRARRARLCARHRYRWRVPDHRFATARERPRWWCAVIHLRAAARAVTGGCASAGADASRLAQTPVPLPRRYPARRQTHRDRRRQRAASPAVVAADRVGSRMGLAGAHEVPPAPTRRPRVWEGCQTWRRRWSSLARADAKSAPWAPRRRMQDRGRHPVLQRWVPQGWHPALLALLRAVRRRIPGGNRRIGPVCAVCGDADEGGHPPPSETARAMAPLR